MIITKRDKVNFMQVYFVKKRFFSIIELLVAVGLLSILLFSLFGFYQMFYSLQEQLDSLREESYQQRYAQFRLNEVLPKSIRAGSSKSFDFFTSKGFSSDHSSLVFVYNRGVDIYPWLSNLVLSRLYLNGNTGELCLVSWPIPSKEREESPPMKREVLLNRVKSVSFQFFTPPDLKKKIDNKHPITTGAETLESPKGQWIPYWDKRFKELPALVEVKVERWDKREENLETFRFAFRFPHSNHQIEYVN